MTTGVQELGDLTKLRYHQARSYVYDTLKNSAAHVHQKVQPGQNTVFLLHAIVLEECQIILKPSEENALF